MLHLGRLHATEIANDCYGACKSLFFLEFFHFTLVEKSV